MVDDIFEQLRALEKDNESSRFTQYVYYDPTDGKILHIRNYLETDETFPYLEIKSDDFDELITLNRYVVIEEDGKKNIVKISDDTNIHTIDDYIHMIPKKIIDVSTSIEDFSFDLLIEQDNILKEFRISLSKVIKLDLMSIIENSKRIVLYVTAENDPNILYKTLEIPMANLVKEKFTIGFDDYDGTPANIYSIRYFENYLHTDIRE